MVASGHRDGGGTEGIYLQQNVRSPFTTTWATFTHGSPCTRLCAEGQGLSQSSQQPSQGGAFIPPAPDPLHRG